MRNVSFEVKANILTITVKLDAPAVTSASGKSLVIATTEGNVSPAVPGCPPEVRVGLNIYRPAK